jgi:alpha-galactosidase
MCSLPESCYPEPMPSKLRFAAILRNAVACLAFVLSAHAGQGSASESSDLRGQSPLPGGLWIESLDLSKMSTGFGLPAVATTVSGNPISIGGVRYVHGIGTHADAELALDLKGNASRLLVHAGIDDDLLCVPDKGATGRAEIEFEIWVDGRKVAASGPMHLGQAPFRFDVPLLGGKVLKMIMRKGPGARYSHATWAGATLFLKNPKVLPVALATGRKAAVLQKEPALSRGEAAQLVSTEFNNRRVWLDELELSKARSNAGMLWLGGIVSRAPKDVLPLRGRSTHDGQPLRVGADVYPHGLIAKGESELRINLKGTAKRFLSRVGFDTNLDCGKTNSAGDALFEVWVDGVPAVRTKHLRAYDRPHEVSVDLSGAKQLVLRSVTEGGGGLWAGAQLLLASADEQKPESVEAPLPAKAVIAARNPDEVRINGPRVVGTTPGRPFLFRIPATGRPPLRFECKDLPAGLSLDAATGIVSGTVEKNGEYLAQLRVVATNGEAQRVLKIVADTDSLAMTPPLGWNSWNAWGTTVDETKVRAAAEALVSTGLAAQGFAYVNIDEGWVGVRGKDGTTNSDAKKFGDMKPLTDFIHAKGLRAGIYSSPGPKSCAGIEGSYQHELADAHRWAQWGFDYLKYDWCSYGQVAKGNGIDELQKPYKLMQGALASTGRDIVFSLCQYGMGDVWHWGRSVGGNLWRTGADIVDTWASLSDIGFSQLQRETGAGPRGWNDPDMMVIGKVGWGESQHDSRLSQDEQVTHVTLWSMLAAPLMLGNDLTALDPFTLDLLSNPEVIDIDQDDLGRQGVRKLVDRGIEIWTRPLSDGGAAIAMFNRSPVPLEASVPLKKLGIRGADSVRDLWLRKDLGVAKSLAPLVIPSHGAVLLRVSARHESPRHQSVLRRLV